MVDWWQIALEFVAVVVGVILAFEFDRHRDTGIRKQEAIEFLTLVKEEIAEISKHSWMISLGSRLSQSYRITGCAPPLGRPWVSESRSWESRGFDERY
jgi:hypothetical protein